jgi:hypothetical protein
MKRAVLLIGFLLTSVLLLPACDNNGEGTLFLKIWGEDYIETGIPAAEFADGYAINYSKFLVNIKNISIEGAFDAPASKVWNIHLPSPSPEGKLIMSDTVDAGSYDHTSYLIARADSATVSGNASPADLKLMKDNGYAVYVQGTATAPDGTQKSFAWGFSNNTKYDPCESDAEVKDGGSDFIQITIHGDHLFYDSTTSADAQLRFAEIASADADNNGIITKEELLAFKLAALPHHDVGNLPIDNMWDYISHQSTTIGHIDGENHCHMTILP